MNAARARQVSLLLRVALLLAALAAEDYVYQSAIGPTFTPPGLPPLTFGAGGPAPDGVATDALGNVYVTLPQGLAKFDATGACVSAYDQLIAGQPLFSCYGLDVGPDGTIYYPEADMNRIATLLPVSGGQAATSYTLGPSTGKNGGDGTAGTGNGEFASPLDVAVDGGYLYVADSGNNRIQKFHIEAGGALSFVAAWGANGGDGTPGSGDGEFSGPKGIAADHQSHLYISDAGNHRIQEIDTAGAFVDTFGSGNPSDPLLTLAPLGIDVAADGSVFVTDSDAATSWVGEFRRVGGVWQLITRSGGFGTGDSQLDLPGGLALDPVGYLYVGDTVNNKLKKFARDATPPSVSVLGVPGGWTQNDVTVDVAALDSAAPGQYASGVTLLQYSLTNGPPWTDFVAPFVVSAEGTTTVALEAADAAGNLQAATVQVRIDKTAPVTAASGVPSGWSKKAVTATLSATDPLSGVATTSYSTNGGVTWMQGTSATVNAEGETTLSWRSTDNAGNVEAPKTATVRIDKTAPVTKASGIPAGWSASPVSVTLIPQDAQSLVASTEYSLDGGRTWAPGTSVIVGKQGRTILAWRSTDNAGNVESTRTSFVYVDSGRPVPRALASVTVRRGKTVKLGYRITDVSPQVNVTVRISRGAKLMKTITLRGKATGKDLTYAYLAKLAKGAYTWKVYATDLAGNTQAKPAVKTLTVK
jgi:sugar lactone lactonase YvrE